MQQRDDSELDQVTAPTAADGDGVLTEERGGPALRDAKTVLARIDADEAMAAAARAAYRESGLPVLEPDERLAAELREGEELHALRSPALLNRPSAARSLPGYAGTLYLTSRRVIHIGQVVFSVGLADIREISVVGERLMLLVLPEAEGVSIDVSEPRLLRVQIAAAKTGRGATAA